MESSTIFPFTSLPLPIQFECIHGTGKAGWKIWRCVNSQYRDYADKFVFTIFVPLDVERIGGCTMHSSGYLTRMRIILAYYKKRDIKIGINLRSVVVRKKVVDLMIENGIDAIMLSFSTELSRYADLARLKVKTFYAYYFHNTADYNGPLYRLDLADWPIQYLIVVDSGWTLGSYVRLSNLTKISCYSLPQLQGEVKGPPKLKTLRALNIMNSLKCPSQFVSSGVTFVGFKSQNINATYTMQYNATS